jgi:hypothetical protein
MVLQAFDRAEDLNSGPFRHKQGLVRKHMLAKRDDKLHLLIISEEHFVRLENDLSSGLYDWLNTDS